MVACGSMFSISFQETLEPNETAGVSEWLEFLVEALDAVSGCVRGSPAAFVRLRARVCVLIYQSWQYFGSAGQEKDL